MRSSSKCALLIGVSTPRRCARRSGEELASHDSRNARAFSTGSAESGRPAYGIAASSADQSSASSAPSSSSFASRTQLAKRAAVSSPPAGSVLPAGRAARASASTTRRARSESPFVGAVSVRGGVGAAAILSIL